LDLSPVWSWKNWTWKKFSRLEKWKEKNCFYQIIFSFYFYQIWIPTLKEHGDDKFYGWKQERLSFWLLNLTFLSPVFLFGVFHFRWELWWVGGVLFCGFYFEKNPYASFISFNIVFIGFHNPLIYVILKLNGNILKFKLIIKPERQV